MPDLPDPVTSEQRDTFHREISAPHEPHWGAITGAVRPIGEPVERFDLMPDKPLNDLAILFGKREGEAADVVHLYNHAMVSLREARATTGDTMRHHFIETAWAALRLADPNLAAIVAAERSTIRRHDEIAQSGPPAPVEGPALGNDKPKQPSKKSRKR